MRPGIVCLKPKQSFWNSGWAKWLLIIGAGVIVIIVAPLVIKTVQGFMGSGSAAAASASGAVKTGISGALVK